MKKRYRDLGIALLSLALLIAWPVVSFAAPPEAPVKGMVTLVDLGAKKCIPCKLMAPILAKLEKVYAGRAAIVFFDVWEDPKPAHRFGVRVIPTQIFFDAAGREVLRHEGFMSEEAIVKQLAAMGVK